MLPKRKEPKSAKDILLNNDFIDRYSEANKYVSEEFQDFGLRLAHQLNDLKHKALYIKLAKQLPRAKLEAAASFASDYPNTKNKGKVFMWKLSQICKITFGKKDKKVLTAKKSQLDLF
ncbi:MAG: hypothetical protein QY330_00720 [Candidatus Dojkabacteria bacterium]|uniref:Uncharacterized protein n=2 Tax=Candidatus Dojkabacteria TaxID=74243 RepID=A0A136KH53_9BACT|nr:MAG: hypothetical protein UZ20_WS6002000742 [candidate division WS6 bacterium OLB21]MBW7953708.1 hypothetical protein [Candidatus Dojkabacteria bacterium]WKZ28117.1 MAG: hypothetical protein QY330_00720 [Candidatus Dojkabacteria bacterium]